MPTHKWHLEVTSQAKDQIKALPTSRQRMAIFAAIRELLIAENPTTVPGVRKLVGAHFADQWRQRQGDYRIFFRVQHNEITHRQYSYKGIVTILKVIHRSRAYDSSS